jgi:hypothetical protein
MKKSYHFQGRLDATQRHRVNQHQNSKYDGDNEQSTKRMHGECLSKCFQNTQHVTAANLRSIGV